MRWPLLLLLLALVTLPGCYYAVGGYYYYDDYSVAVTATGQPDPTFAGTPVDLDSVYAIDNAQVYITTQDWTVTTAPAGAIYVLDDDGRSATLLATTPGTYTVRYRTWYYTDWDYGYCYCTTATGYREAFVTITVVAAPSA